MTDLLRILIGPLAWLGSFSAVYGLQGITCAFGWAETGVWGTSLLRLALLAAWLCAIALQIMILVGLHVRHFASQSGFVHRVSRMTGWVGLIAILWSLFPVVATSSCQ